MKKALKIIFLDFTGTIDKPYVYREPVFTPSKKIEGFKYHGDVEPGTAPSTLSERDELLIKSIERGFKEPAFSEEVEGQAEIEERRAGIESEDDGTENSGYAYTPSLPGILPKKTVEPYPYDGYYRFGHARRYSGRYSEYDEGDHYESTGFGFRDHAYEECVKYLKMLGDKTGAKIVYSTTYRHSGWKHCADFVGLPYEYSLGGPDDMSVTPSNVPTKKISWYKNIPFFNKKDNDFGKSRQREIREWLRKWSGLNIENYVILDDDEITDPQLSKHWVSSIRQNRFLKDQYEEALKILENKA